MSNHAIKILKSDRNYSPAHCRPDVNPEPFFIDSPAPLRDVSTQDHAHFLLVSVALEIKVILSPSSSSLSVFILIVQQIVLLSHQKYHNLLKTIQHMCQLLWAPCGWLLPNLQHSPSLVGLQGKISRFCQLRPQIFDQFFHQKLCHFGLED